MDTDKIQKKYKKSLIFSSILLFALSVFTHQYTDIVFYRLTGVLSIITFFGILFLIHRSRISYMLSYFLVANIISSVLFIWFENDSAPVLIVAIYIISLLTLILYLLPKLKGVVLKARDLIIYFILILSSSYLFYSLIYKVYALDPQPSNGYYISLILYAFFLITLTVITLLYNHKKKSKATLMFVFFWLLYVFSNILYVLGYYQIVFSIPCIYLSRLLFIAALSTLVYYTVLNEKEKPRDNIRYL